MKQGPKRRGSIIELGPKHFEIQVSLPRQPGEPRRRKSLAVDGTRLDAEKALTNLLAEIDKGAYVAPSKLIMTGMLDVWLRDYARPNTAPKTYERYVEMAERWAGVLGPVKLSELSPARVQTQYTTWLSTGRVRRTKDGLRPEGGLSKQTILHHHRLLSQVLKQAMKWGFVARNVCDMVTPPRPDKSTRPTYEWDEVRTLLEAAKSSYMYAPIVVAIFGALRRGEVFGLRWADIDFDKATVRVAQVIEHTREFGTRIKEYPKNSSSRREISVDDYVLDALKTVKAQQAREKLALGPAYKQNDLVFTMIDGSPRNPNSMSTSYSQIIARAKIKKITFHDLRHTHATLLADEDQGLNVIKDRLGHSSIKVTGDLYAHVSRKQDGRARDAFGEAFRKNA